MAGTVKGEVRFQALGADHVLLFDINALCSLEDVSGMKVTEIGQQFGDNMSIKLLRSMFWAGLLSGNEDVTQHQAGQIMSAVGAKKAGELIGRAFQAAFPEAKPKGAANAPEDPQTAGGTGAAS